MLKSLTIKSLPISLAALLILSLQTTSAQAARIYNHTYFDKIKVIGGSAFVFDPTPEIIIDRGTRSDSLEWKTSAFIYIAGSIERTPYKQMSDMEKQMMKNQYFCDEKDRNRLNIVIKIPEPDRTNMMVCWRPLTQCGSLHTPLARKMVGGNYGVVSQRDASAPVAFISNKTYSCSGFNKVNY
jgi:hypothetical protein